ncbi:iron ABC transporter permease [Williamsia deligens]|nr:thiamine transport system permease protein [Williamsia deligens]
MNRDRRARLAGGVLATLPLLFLAVLFVWPVVALVHRAVDVSDGAGLGALLTRTNAWGLLGFTLAQAAASTVLTLVVAAPLVWLVTVVPRWASTPLMVVVTVPFVLPTVVVGIAFRAMLSPGGPLGSLGLDGSVASILAAHAFLNVAVVVRIVGSSWRALDPRAEQAARTLGASGPRAFLTVVAPRLALPVVSAASLVFLFCATSFGVVVILGGGRLQTLETAVYTQAIGYFDIPAAVAVSVVQIVVVVVAVAVTRVLTPRTQAAIGGPRARVALTPARRAWTLAAALWGLVVLVGPLVVVALRSVRPTAGGSWTWEGYRALTVPVNGETPLDTLRSSVISALWATVIAVAVGLLAAVALHRSRGPARAVGDALTLLPLGVSAVTLGFGYLIVLAALPAAVASSPVVVPAVQALVAAPVVVRVLLPALAAVPQTVRQAAAGLGAGPWRVWRTVDLPAIWRPLGVAVGFSFVIALGEFGATGFVTRPGTTTLPVLIGSALNRPGAQYLATAMAASMLLIVTTAVVVVAMEALRDVEGSEF